ncbi:MAG: [FeFe] hydrogenase H-cluster radical SAM maturase HydE [Bacteroidota bacterium]
MVVNDEIYDKLTAEKIHHLLSLSPMDTKGFFAKARQTRDTHIGNQVYLRGLIELSNRCAKNCYYCGIRCGNTNVVRYDLPDEEVLKAAQFALQNRYGSIVIQSGELNHTAFTNRITSLLQKINTLTRNQLHITLSCGEQTEQVYRQWFAHGAQRYLLRIETSNEQLYYKIHPHNRKHSFTNRLQSIETLKSIGFQTGTGIMIGLPHQTTTHLANDLLFFKNTGIHMVGMGPYIAHPDTPLAANTHQMLTLNERFELCLKMIACLRLLMPDINIAATTALQTIDPMGREKGIAAGANVIMPNITPAKYKENYTLYNGKPCLDEEPDQCTPCIAMRVKLAGSQVAWNEWGDSKQFARENL